MTITLLIALQITNFKVFNINPRYDHQERLTAQEAMAHPYFAPVRAAEAAAGGK